MSNGVRKWLTTSRHLALSSRTPRQGAEPAKIIASEASSHCCHAQIPGDYYSGKRVLVHFSRALVTLARIRCSLSFCSGERLSECEAGRRQSLADSAEPRN